MNEMMVVMKDEAMKWLTHEMQESIMNYCGFLYFMTCKQEIAIPNFGFQRWPLGGGSVDIVRYFRCQILTAPCSASCDRIATHVATSSVLEGGCQ
jgi:hypothetical protein